MRKLGIMLTTLLLLGVLVFMLFGIGLLPFPAIKERKHTVWRPKGFFASSREEQADYTFSAVPTLKVQNPLGDIRVQGTDGQEVRVSLSKKTEAKMDRRAEELLENVTLETHEQGQDKELIVHIPSSGEGEQVRADLLILAPYSTGLDLHAGLGGVFVASTAGQLRVINELGPIEVLHHIGNAALETHLGNIRISDCRFTDELVAITRLGDLYVEGQLAENNVLESELGGLTLLLSPNEAYILQGTLRLGDFSTTVPFKGEHSGGKIKGVVGEGAHRGLIFVNLELGSIQLTTGKGGKE